MSESTPYSKSILITIVVFTALTFVASVLQALFYSQEFMKLSKVLADLQKKEAKKMTPEGQRQIEDLNTLLSSIIRWDVIEILKSFACVVMSCVLCVVYAKSNDRCLPRSVATALLVFSLLIIVLHTTTIQTTDVRAILFDMAVIFPPFLFSIISSSLLLAKT
jgi:hypothetical protein